MKLMIASDIHGSAACCRRLMDALHREKPQRLLLLGDLLYHGPRNGLPEEYDPQQVAAMLNQHRNILLCIRGNCDAEVDQMMLQFPILSDSCLLFRRGKTILAVHGHHTQEQLPALQKGDILLSGHTHIPACFLDENGILHLNPGSVSIPKENSSAGYMVFEEQQVIWRDLDGIEIQTHSLI